MTSPTDVTAVDHLDLERYLGLWYEIARLPMRYEDDAASNVTAAYALNEDGSIQVDNRCFDADGEDRKSTRLNSSHVAISYAVFCLKKKKKRRKHQSSQSSNRPH